MECLEEGKKLLFVSPEDTLDLWGLPWISNEDLERGSACELLRPLVTRFYLEHMERFKLNVLALVS